MRHRGTYRLGGGTGSAVSQCWERGLRALNSANGEWKALIGAKRYYAYNGNQIGCVCTDLTGLQMTPPGGHNTLDCQSLSNSEYTCEPLYEVHVSSTEEPSDGIVPISSQMAYPGAERMLMVNTNHQNMRNNSETKDRLRELWDAGYGEFFRTPIR